jgi:hypothetical protein
VKYVFGLAVVVALAFVGWQFLAPEFTNYLLQDELHDLAAQTATRIGLTRPTTDEDLRNIIIKKAASHDIVLEPRQVTVRRSGTGENASFYLAADYTVEVTLPGYSCTLHFAPSSTGGKQ